MVSKRSKRGSVTAFSAVLALALLVLGIGFLFIVLYMGAQRETKNATDAGALNVGKKVLTDISVPLNGSANQACFKDCSSDSFDNNASRDSKITLERINRVWAKAMLIAINAEAADSDGQGGSGSGNASQAESGAQEISNALADKLTTPSNLHGFFSELAQVNSVRMIGVGSKTTVLPGGGWQTSLMDREAESNIQLTGTPSNNFYLPPGFTLPADASTQCTRTPMPSAVAGDYFLKGYVPIKVGSKTFWQVPFKWDNKPILVASSKFDAEKASANAVQWSKPVPNAFSVEGQALKAGAAGEKASSWVLSNPRKPFKLAAPHSFLHVKVDQPKCHWYFYPVPPFKVEFGAAQNYDFNSSPTSMSGTPMPGGGVLCSLVTPPSQTVGLDIAARSLDDVIFGLPNLHTSETKKIENYMVTRANEMISKPGVVITPAKLHTCLDNALTRLALIAGQKDFYVYSADGETLQCDIESVAQVKAITWMPGIIGNNPDGSEKKIIDDDYMPGGIPPVMPHAPTPLPFCSPTPLVKSELNAGVKYILLVSVTRSNFNSNSFVKIME